MAIISFNLAWLSQTLTCLLSTLSSTKQNLYWKQKIATKTAATLDSLLKAFFWSVENNGLLSGGGFTLFPMGGLKEPEVKSYCWLFLNMTKINFKPIKKYPKKSIVLRVLVSTKAWGLVCPYFFRVGLWFRPLSSLTRFISFLCCLGCCCTSRISWKHLLYFHLLYETQEE